MNAKLIARRRYKRNAADDDTPTPLSERQKRVVDGLEHGILTYVAAANAYLDKPFPAPGFKQPRLGNVFVIDGDRGQGKTTLMTTLRERLARREGVLVTRPFDASLCPPSVPLSLAVAHLLRETMLNSLQDAGPSRRDTDDAVSGTVDTYARANEERAFEAFERALVQVTPRAEQVADRVSLSIGQFTRSMDSTTDQHLHLPHRAAEWLRALMHVGRRKGAVVMVDDIDMMVAGLAPPFLFNLLDVFHQPHLCFVLGAHLQRLERELVIASGHARENAVPTQIDAGVADALVYKIVAPSERFLAPTFGLSERRAFSPGRDARGKRQPPLQERLAALLHLAGVPADGAKRFDALLPGNPRGLAHLYGSINRALGLHEDLPSLSKILSWFAEARRSTLLKRELAAHDDLRWVAALTWPDSPTGASSWGLLAARARLDPMATDTHAVNDKDGTRRILLPSPEASAMEILATSLDKTPFEGLAAGDAALWMEVMLDLLMESRELSPWSVVERIPSLRRRFDAAAFTSRCFAGVAQNAYDDERPLMRAANLVVEWGSMGEVVTYSAGLAHWVRAIAGERLAPRGLPFAQMGAVGSAAEAEPLPRTLRALVLFAHHLDQVPWAAMSEIGWLRTADVAASLAVAMTLAALARALNLTTDSEDVRALIDAAGRREDAEPARWSDGQIRERLVAIIAVDPKSSAMAPGSSAPQTRAALIATFDAIRKHPIVGSFVAAST